MPVTVKFPWKYKTVLFGVLVVSWVSGLTFYVLARMIRVEGEFGLEQHPLQYPVLQVHGAAAFLMMISYGYLLASHVRASWKTKKNRTFGILLIACHGGTIVTGYLLYYLSGEGLAYKNLVSYAHFTIGFMYPFLLVSHMSKGKKGVGEACSVLSLLCAAIAFLYLPLVFAIAGLVLGLVVTLTPSFRTNGLAFGGIALSAIVLCFSGKEFYEKRMGALVWDPWSYEMERIPEGDEWESEFSEDSWDSGIETFTSDDGNESTPPGIETNHEKE